MDYAAPHNNQKASVGNRITPLDGLRAAVSQLNESRRAVSEMADHLVGAEPQEVADPERPKSGNVVSDIEMMTQEIHVLAMSILNDASRVLKRI